MLQPRREVVDGEIDMVARVSGPCSEPLSIQTVVMPIALAGVRLRAMSSKKIARVGSIAKAAQRPA